MSKYLSKLALKALNRIGDIMLPENGEFPKFSDTGGIEHIDDLAAYAPASDMKDLSMLLGILAYAPNFVLKWLVNKMETAYDNDGFMGTLFRQLDFGLRGLIFSLYYGDKMGSDYTGKDPMDIVGFKINRVTD